MSNPTWRSSLQDLEVAEINYLKQNGWTILPGQPPSLERWWKPPDAGFSRKEYRHGHAVNAQKQFDYNRMRHDSGSG